jgi:hypothetical protein
MPSSSKLSARMNHGKPFVFFQNPDIVQIGILYFSKTH